MLNLRNRFTSQPENSCYSRREINILRRATLETQPHGPEQIIWSTLQYPGSLTLPVHLLLLPETVPTELSAPLDQLHNAMRQEGVPYGYLDTRDKHEHRQAHLWVATVGIRKYLPIGQAMFLAERRRVDDSLGGGFVSKWWMLYAWIRPSYRNQKIFQKSIDYCEKWHPYFILRDTTPVLVSALKNHPGHFPKEFKQVNWF